jgi:hypothetical protein
MLEVAIRSLEIALDPQAALTGIDEKDERQPMNLTR